VLLKGYDERGFVFFTNYDSRKGRELAANPNAALLFFWPELETPGTHRRSRRARRHRGIRCLLPQPSTGEPHRRVGIAAE